MWKKTFCIFALAAALPLGATVTLAWVADPYGVWDPPRFVGVNQTPYRQETNDRLAKPVQMGRQPIDALILGDSKAEFGLSPAVYAAITGLPHVYNAGLRGARPGEMRDFLERAIRENPGLQEVLLCVDYEGFIERDTRAGGYETEQTMQPHLTRKNVFRTLLTQTAAVDSLLNLRENHRMQGGYPVIGADGKFSEGELAYIFGQEDDFEGRIHTILAGQARGSGPSAREKHLSELRAIRDLCDAHGIRLRVLIPPVHALHLAAYHEDWDAYCAWERSMTDLFPVLDFASFRPVAEERTSFWDIGHMKEVLGSRVLARALADGDEDGSGEAAAAAESFGTLVTEATVEAHLEELGQEYEAWMAAHPDARRIVDVSWGFAEALPEEDAAIGSSDARVIDVPAMAGATEEKKSSDALRLQGTLPLPPLSLRALYAVLEADDGTRFYARAQKRRYDDIAFQQILHDGRGDPCTYDIDAPLAGVTPGRYSLRVAAIAKDGTACLTSPVETLDIAMW